VARPGGPLSGVSIRWKLTAAYVALVTAIVLVLGLALYRGLESFLLEDVATRTAAAVDKVVTRELTRQPLSRDPEATPRPIRNPRRGDIRRLGRDLVSEISGRDTAVIVMWPDGSVLQASDPVPDVAPWPVPTTDEIAEAQATSGPIRRVDSTRSPRALLTVEGVRTVDGDLVAISAVATTLEGGDSALAQLRTALIVGLIAAIVLGILLGLPLTRILLRPLDRVVDTAQRISAGDRSVRVGEVDDRTEIGRLGVAFDTMVDRLEASAEIQRRFVADASHELRTPLAALGGMTEMLLLGIDQGDKAAVDRVLTAMHREIGRMGRLASDLLLLSQLEDTDGGGGRLPLAKEPVDVAALAAEVVETMAPLTDGRTVRVEVETGLIVVGDRDRLKQVLVNLVENAARHTKPGGSISVGGRLVDGWVHLFVTDDGEGLASDDAERIFDRFYRADEARARGPNDGSGLGLAIVRAIAEAHGGRAAADSPGPGRGTTVLVVLPAPPAEPGPWRADAPSSGNHQESPGQTTD
jgi:two-component system, OmpR family, sensor kinase